VPELVFLKVYDRFSHFGGKSCILLLGSEATLSQMEVRISPFLSFFYEGSSSHRIPLCLFLHLLALSRLGPSSNGLFHVPE